MRVLAAVLLITTAALAEPMPPPATGLLGHPVLNQSAKELGMIVDVLVGPDGAPLAAIVDFGGFLGVGTRRIAVGWPALRFTAGKDGLDIALDIPSERLKSAPAFDPAKPLEALAPPNP